MSLTVIIRVGFGIRSSRKTPGGPTAAQNSVIVEQANNYGALYDLAPVILKIPGTVGETGPRLTITEDQYLDFFSKRELASIIPSQLLTKLRSSNHLFLATTFANGVCERSSIASGKTTKLQSFHGPCRIKTQRGNELLGGLWGTAYSREA